MRPSPEKTTNPNRLIVLLADKVSEPFFTAFAGYFGRRAATMGYKLVLGSPELIHIFRNMDPMAYIIVPSKQMAPAPNLQQMEGKPVVVFSQHFSYPGGLTISPDDFKGGYDAASHLIVNGLREIAFFTTFCSQRLDRRR
jgi:DNA-binding LacI/PurR family transcriptional regulator